MNSLTAGRKAYAPVVDHVKPSGPKTVSSAPAAASSNVLNKKKDSIPSSTGPRAPAEPVAKPRPANLEAPRSQDSSLSATEEEAELHRYDIAWRELETGKMHRGLWGRAFVMAEGDEHKTKIQYLKERTEYLKKVEQRQEEQGRVQKLRELGKQKTKRTRTFRANG